MFTVEGDPQPSPAIHILHYSLRNEPWEMWPTRTLEDLSNLPGTRYTYMNTNGIKYNGVIETIEGREVGKIRDQKFDMGPLIYSYTCAEECCSALLLGVLHNSCCLYNEGLSTVSFYHLSCLSVSNVKLSICFLCMMVSWPAALTWHDPLSEWVWNDTSTF